MCQQEEPSTPLSMRSMKREVKEVAKEVADMAIAAAAPVVEATKKRVRLQSCAHAGVHTAVLVHP